MRVVQASLCLRFYRSAGWTREAVRELLSDDKRLARVFPRYFDDRDQAGNGSFELDDGLPHDDCDYFAVYGACNPFSAEALAQHDIA
jgi:predicted HD phosphohydrolase